MGAVNYLSHAARRNASPAQHSFVCLLGFKGASTSRSLCAHPLSIPLTGRSTGWQLPPPVSDAPPPSVHRADCIETLRWRIEYIMSLLEHPDTFKAIYRFGFDFARVRVIDTRGAGFVNVVPIRIFAIRSKGRQMSTSNF